jgi:hypothetical protein
MKITFTRRRGYVGSLSGMSVWIDDQEVQCLYPGNSYVFEGEPKQAIRITGWLMRPAIIPIENLEADNAVYLQFTVGFWNSIIQAIVYSGEKFIGIFEKERLF